MSAAADRLTTETAAEYLRLALPLMSQQRVSTTPENYAVWYTYVSGANAELNAEIDRLMAEKKPFTGAVCARLYQEFVAEHDVGNIEQVRAQLNRILSEVGLSLDEAGDGARAFEGKLGGLVDSAAEKSDLSDIRQMLQTLIAETRSMQDATQGMRSQFESKSKEIEELHEQLQRERRRANTDTLTGLCNRFALLEELNRAIAEMPNDAPPSVVMLDIDHFKSVNDTHGHLIGDRVIRFVAQVLEKNIKGKDSAARYGGEEFTVLLPETPGGGARSVAESIRKAVESAQLVRSDNKKPLGRITISAGVATFQAGEDVMEFVNRADQALYRSKREGRNRVSVA
jgi:diguanylate cyclase